jgi:hypothetical protein
VVVVKTRVFARINDLEGKKSISARKGIDYAVLAAEMEQLFYFNAQYHPTRWYTAASDYRGVYVTTDPWGWRIDRTTIPEGAAKLLCFGGSTMFSTTTGDEGTIPAKLQQRLVSDRACALNYGMGGYSTYAEIGAFCEALRRERNVTLAIFYEGVNEIAMHLEMLMHRREKTFLADAGYPFMTVVRVAIRNYLKEQGVVWRAAAWLAGKACRMLGGRGCEPAIAQEGRIIAERDLFEHARRVVEGYITNIRILRGIGEVFGVPCIFVWQPDIFSTRKRLTEREHQILENAQPTLRTLSTMVHRLVVAHPTFTALGGVDATAWLDSLEGEHFFDYCHVSEEANEVIAEKLAGICESRTPTSFWRKP